VSDKRSVEEKQRLRELAARTLEAYRNLNSAAARAVYTGNGPAGGEGLKRAGDLLESVLAEMRPSGKRQEP
jgi:hypothetical protein